MGYNDKKIFIKLRQLHSNIRQTEHIYMALAALAVAGLGGLSTVGFRKLIDFGQDSLYLRDRYVMPVRICFHLPKAPYSTYLSLINRPAC